MSNSTDLAAVLRLLEEALDLPLAERAEWLADVRRTEPAVAAKVGAMLSSEERLDRDGCLAEFPAPPPAGSIPLAGLQLRGYTLERPLGRGGMGTVWLARRCDGRRRANRTLDAEVRLRYVGSGKADTVCDA